MKIQLNIESGSMEDIATLRNILNNYDIRADYVSTSPNENEMGTEFWPALILILPEITQFANALLPALKTYIDVKKPSGTKRNIELINGEKKISILNEDGVSIDINKILNFCDKIHFFD